MSRFGLGSTSNQTTPALLSGSQEALIAAGGTHSVALKGHGRVARVGRQRLRSGRRCIDDATHRAGVGQWMAAATMTGEQMRASIKLAILSFTMIVAVGVQGFVAR